jgi:hypothetical protein
VYFFEVKLTYGTTDRGLVHAVGFQQLWPPVCSKRTGHRPRAIMLCIDQDSESGACRPAALSESFVTSVWGRRIGQRSRWLYRELDAQHGSYATIVQFLPCPSLPDPCLHTPVCSLHHSPTVCAWQHDKPRLGRAILPRRLATFSTDVRNSATS